MQPALQFMCLCTTFDEAPYILQLFLGPGLKTSGVMEDKAWVSFIYNLILNIVDTTLKQ